MGEKRGGGLFVLRGQSFAVAAPWGVAGAGSSRMSECRGAAVGSRKGKGRPRVGFGGGWDVRLQDNAEDKAKRSTARR